jgi:putative lipoic acid-binding regulatory protein
LSEQNSFTEMEYPARFTYKMMGDDTPEFRDSVNAVFVMKEILEIQERKSSSGKYVSMSVTVDVENYGELASIYEMISQIEGLKYHL